MFVFRLLRYTMRFGANVQEVMRRTWQVARTPRERVDGIRFLLTFLAVKTGYRAARFLPVELALRVHGVTFYLGVYATELSVLQEVYVQRVYDRHPDFIPHPGWIIIDVGANIGAYSLLQAQRGAYVIAVEPNPSVFHSLRHAVTANRMDTEVDTVHAALSDVEGWGVVHMTQRSTPGGVVLPLTLTASGGPAVRCVTLDILARNQNVPRIDLLKIDAEGAEATILRGGMDTLPRVERIQVEYHTDALRQEVVDLLHEAGLTVVHHVPQPLEAGILYACRNPSAG